MSLPIPITFREISPYSPEELPQAIDRLLADAAFRRVAEQVIGDIPFDTLAQIMRSSTDSLEIQRKIIYPLLIKLLAQTSKGATLDDAALTQREIGHTFVSNHRDIVMDSAFLCKLLLDRDYPTTVEIAIGDNLLIHPWIETLVRINKAFIVRRTLTPKHMLAASQLMSQYMHFAITQKHENIWIAQREGRAKNADDRTDPALLKMLAMGGEGTPEERLQALRIVPLCISYEYDPCDYLKAQEFQEKRDNPSYKKRPEDDLLNMKTGIFGYKGRIHYAMSECINTQLAAFVDLPRSRFFTAVAALIDKAIFAHYHLYPINYIALDRLEGTHLYQAYYTPQEEEEVTTYLQGQLAKVNLEHPDLDFLRCKILEMYANPARNALRYQTTPIQPRV